MAAAALLVMIVFVLWELFDWPPGHRTLIGDLFAYPPDLMAIGAAWAASLRCTARPRLRSAWRLIALSWTCLLLGDIIWTVYELLGSRPYPSVADGFYLAVLSTAAVGTAALPGPRRNARAKDPAQPRPRPVVAIGGAIVVIYVVLGPTPVMQSGPDPLQTGISIAYPVGDLVLLVGLGSVVLLRKSPPSSAPRASVHGSPPRCLLVVVADVIYGYITLHGTYHGGDQIDSLYILSSVAFRARGSRADRTSSRAPLVAAGSRQRASWAPAIAVAIGFGLLIYSERDDRLLPQLSVVIAAVLMAVLVSLRQFLAQKDLVQRQRAR